MCLAEDVISFNAGGHSRIACSTRIQRQFLGLLFIVVAKRSELIGERRYALVGSRESGLLKVDCPLAISERVGESIRVGNGRLGGEGREWRPLILRHGGGEGG